MEMINSIPCTALLKLLGINIIGYNYPMTSKQQKESLALSSLHDISDYTSYIDQRILKLNLLYQTLSSEPSYKKEHSRFKIASSQPANEKLYQTVQERFIFNKKNTSETTHNMYCTQYVCKNKRYAQITQPFHSLESNSYHKSNQKSIYTSKQSSKSLLKSFAKNNRDQKNQLKDYELLKQQMLSTFYVGKKGSGSAECESKQLMRASECRQNETKFKKRKIWRGRPPIKIVYKFQ